MLKWSFFFLQPHPCLSIYPNPAKDPRNPPKLVARVGHALPRERRVRCSASVFRLSCGWSTRWWGYPWLSTAGGGFSSYGFLSQTLVVHHRIESGDMGREEEREIRKAESLPWPRNDGVRCSISMARSREGSRGEESQGRSRKVERVSRQRISKEERERQGLKERETTKGWKAPSLSRFLDSFFLFGSDNFFFNVIHVHIIQISFEYMKLALLY